jgi:hypothetical protein
MYVIIISKLRIQILNIQICDKNYLKAYCMYISIFYFISRNLENIFTNIFIFSNACITVR